MFKLITALKSSPDKHSAEAKRVFLEKMGKEQITEKLATGQVLQSFLHVGDGYAEKKILHVVGPDCSNRKDDKSDGVLTRSVRLS